MRIGIIGTRGIPPRYGGFETAVAEVASRLVQRGHEVVVYCRGTDHSAYLNGIQRIWLPSLALKQTETISHAGLSSLDALRRNLDCAIVFNSANGVFVPLLQARGIPCAVHIDGLEWKRARWRGFGARYYSWAERFSVAHATHIIADSRGIERSVAGRHGRESVFIPYGAPDVVVGPEALSQFGLEPDAYHLVVARLEPENNVHVIVEGYRRSQAHLPLVIVGDSPYSHSYVQSIQALTQGDSRIRLTGSVWDDDALNALYHYSRSYLHGHSVGGTNPSLLRAMGAGAAVTAFDCEFNREVSGANAVFFSDADQLGELIIQDDRMARRAARGASGKADVLVRYRWDKVAADYEELCYSLVQDHRHRS